MKLKFKKIEEKNNKRERERERERNVMHFLQATCTQVRQRRHRLEG